MNTFKKAAVAAAVSLAATNAIADASSTDAVRDNLMDLYNEIGGSGTWGTSGYNAHGAIEDLVEHATLAGRIQLIFNPGTGQMEIKAGADYTEFDDKIADLEDAVIDDMFGTDFDIENDDFFATDGLSGDLEIGSNISDTSLFGSKLDDATDNLNTTINAGVVDNDTITDAIDDFKTDSKFTAFNDHFAPWYRTEDADGNTLTGTDRGHLQILDAVHASNSATAVIKYGLSLNTATGQYESEDGDGNTVCYENYEKYALGTTEVCD